MLGDEIVISTAGFKALKKETAFVLGNALTSTLGERSEIDLKSLADLDLRKEQFALLKTERGLNHMNGDLIEGKEERRETNRGLGIKIMSRYLAFPRVKDSPVPYPRESS